MTRRTTPDPRPSVTVIVLNWNGAGMLPSCLGSLAALDYPAERVDVVVVDNGSTDGSVDLLRTSHPGVRVIAHPENRGFAAANNGAARSVTSDYVAFLNNDARVDPRWLSALVDHLEATPSMAAAGSLVLDWSGRRVDFGRAAMTALGRGQQPGHGLPLERAPREPSVQLFANGAAMLARREVFLDAGGFDERYFAYYEDVDLGWRLWVLGWEVGLVPASVAFHRHHGTSRHVPREQVELLLARNSVFSIVKNYDDARLGRYLPIALLALGEAIERELGVDPRSLRISERDPSAGRRVSAAPHGRIRRLARRVRGLVSSRRGLLSTARSVLARRGGNPAAAALAAAMADVLAAWPELMAERASIQSRRRRDDEAIIGLFRLDELPAAATDGLASVAAAAPPSDEPPPTGA